jgi:hypothetical protein
MAGLLAGALAAGADWGEGYALLCAGAGKAGGGLSGLDGDVFAAAVFFEVGFALARLRAGGMD